MRMFRRLGRVHGCGRQEGRKKLKAVEMRERGGNGL